MIHLALPLGSRYGWGVCGKCLTLEMARLAELRLLTDPFTAGDLDDELEYHSLRQALPTAEELAVLTARAETRVAGPVLQCIQNKQMLPYRPALRGDYTVGYAFFEDRSLSPQAVDTARRCFDHVASGSSWCTEVLRGCGLSRVSTVLQGVDPALFEPSAPVRQHFADRFVVFSGGKLELRKGQDLAIRAYKVLQDKHADVMLVTAWANPWTANRNTMQASPYIRFAPTARDHATLVNQVLADSGIDTSRTIHLAAHPQAIMARVYKNTDVGLFPNRCEGGTNLVLMEYMACARPAIASFATGHKDILSAENSLRIESMGRLRVRQQGAVVAEWDDPDLDETIAHLEYAYQHRDHLQAIGRQAGADIARLTWQRTAQQFFHLLHPS